MSPIEGRKNTPRFAETRTAKSPGPGAYSPNLSSSSHAYTLGNWRGLGTGWQFAPDLSLPGPGTYNMQPSFVSTKPSPAVSQKAPASVTPVEPESSSPRKLHSSLFTQNPQLQTTGDFQRRVAAFYEAAQLERARAKRAALPTFAEVKLRAEKEVLQLRQRP